MSLQATAKQQVKQKLLRSALLQNLSILIFGAVVLFAVGFLPMDAVHNAAHDSRHALAFPCH